jgi:hypothetical protein
MWAYRRPALVLFISCAPLRSNSWDSKIATNLLAPGASFFVLPGASFFLALGSCALLLPSPVLPVQVNRDSKRGNRIDSLSSSISRSIYRSISRSIFARGRASRQSPIRQDRHSRERPRRPMPSPRRWTAAPRPRRHVESVLILGFDWCSAGNRF